MLKESVSYVTQTSFFIISSKFLTILSVYFEMETETSVATIKLMNQYLVKLDSFYGTNFTRWKYKFKFLLTALKIFYVLDPELAPIPEPTNEDSDELKAERKKRREDELICRGHILNALSDRLYDLYTDTQSTVEIWNALEFKYKAEEEGTKKFLISKYFDFKMVDDKPILVQHELQVLANKLRAGKIDITETFHVGAILLSCHRLGMVIGRNFFTTPRTTLGTTAETPSNQG